MNGATVLLIVFVLWELTTDHPTINLRVFKENPVPAASFTGIFLLTIALHGGLFLTPIFVQQILGLPAFC